MSLRFEWTEFESRQGTDTHELRADRLEWAGWLGTARFVITSQLLRLDALRRTGPLADDGFEASLTSPWVLGYFRGVAIAAGGSSGMPPNEELFRGIEMASLGGAFGEDQVAAASSLTDALKATSPIEFETGYWAGMKDYQLAYVPGESSPALLVEHFAPGATELLASGRTDRGSPGRPTKTLRFWTTDPMKRYTALFDDIQNDRLEAKAGMGAARVCVLHQLRKADILRQQGELDADRFEEQMSSAWGLGYLMGVGHALTEGSGFAHNSQTDRALRAIPVREAFGDDQVRAAGALVEVAVVENEVEFLAGVGAAAKDFNLVSAGHDANGLLNHFQPHASEVWDLWEESGDERTRVQAVPVRSAEGSTSAAGRWGFLRSGTTNNKEGAEAILVMFLWAAWWTSRAAEVKDAFTTDVVSPLPAENTRLPASVAAEISKLRSLGDFLAASGTDPYAANLIEGLVASDMPSGLPIGALLGARATLEDVVHVAQSSAQSLHATYELGALFEIRALANYLVQVGRDADGVLRRTTSGDSVAWLMGILLPFGEGEFVLSKWLDGMAGRTSSTGGS